MSRRARRPTLLAACSQLDRPDTEHHYHLHNDAGKRTATVVLGRVKRFHVRSDLIDDSLLVDTDKLQPVSRLGGITYGRTTSVYETPRPAFDKVKDSEDVKKLLAKA